MSELAQKPSIEREHAVSSAYEQIPEQVKAFIEGLPAYDRRAVEVAMGGLLVELYDEAYETGFDKAQLFQQSDALAEIIEENGGN